MVAELPLTVGAGQARHKQFKSHGENAHAGLPFQSHPASSGFRRKEPLLTAGSLPIGSTLCLIEPESAGVPRRRVDLGFRRAVADPTALPDRQIAHREDQARLGRGVLRRQRREDAVERDRYVARNEGCSTTDAGVARRMTHRNPTAPIAQTAVCSSVARDQAQPNTRL